MGEQEDSRMRRFVRGGAPVAVLTVVAALAAQPANASAPTAASTVTVQAGSTLATIQPGAVGANEPVWNPRLPDAAVPALVRKAGIKMLSFNAGPITDLYHWKDGTLSPDPDPADHPYDYVANLPPQFSFDQFATTAQKSGAQMLIHVNYGTGTPQEAADWVRYANKVKHLNIKYWAIGEEIWGNGGISGGLNFQPDGHADKSPQAYGNNSLQFIAAMKAVDPSIKVGVELSGVSTLPVLQQWDTAVLSTVGSAVDFVDYHQYPFMQDDTSDAGLLTVPRQIPARVAALRALVNQYSGSRVQIVAGETNSAALQAPQQISTFNALYLADDLVTLLENGVTNVDWWALHNGGYGSTRGDLGLLSTGDCDDTNTVCAPPTDTPYPPYYGMQLTGAIAQAGGKLVTATSSNSLVVSHAVREPDGSLAVMLINEDPANAQQVSLSLQGYQACAGATVLSYGQGSTAVSVTHDAKPANAVRTLAPYSITVLVLQPAR
jgi:hypothetical protein